MYAILSVGCGSDEESKFIIMEYYGGSKKDKPIILVGKGVTFDTGGINLKSSNGLFGMNMDMSGGASVIHTLALVAKMKLKKNVVAIIPSVENMASGKSYRPGDIIHSMSGKNIEILNTDAEGRVILADALTYAKKYKPEVVIDVYSSDKDLKQLLDHNVFCVDPMKNIRVDTKQFLQEFLFAPTLMLDYLALIGDSSDNIPGVAGIWPKKASDLIKQYGSLDAIYAHVEELTPDLKQKLSEQREIAYMSRDLVNLHLIPWFSTSLSDLKCVIDFERYKQVLVKDFQFSSLEKTLDEMRKKFIMPQQSSLF